VLTFRCPACGKQHAASEPFEKAYDVECLRCAATIHVTAELLHGAATGIGNGKDTQILPDPGAKPAGVTAKAAVKARPGAKGRGNGHAPTELDRSAAGGGLEAAELDTEMENEAAGEEEEEQEGGPKKAVKKKKPRKPSKPGEGDKDADEPEKEDATGPRSPEEMRQLEMAAFGGPPLPWWKKHWQILAGGGGGALVLLLVVFFLFGRSSTSKKPPTSAPRAAAKPATPAPAAKVEDKAPEPLLKPTSKDVVHLSAVRLSTELAANPAEANRKYEHLLLEVSGHFKQLEKKESLDKPARNHVVLAGPGKPIYCDFLTSTTDPQRWLRLKANEQLTVRGVYSKDGFLHVCELLPYAAPADSRYRGKEIELSGYVEAVLPDGEGAAADGFASAGAGFPTIRLERDETVGLVGVECLFRKTDADEVKKVQVGSHVVVRGVCSGRGKRSGQFRVRLDNCQFVATSAPTPPTPRLEVPVFLREYEEDLRPTLLPPPGAEERVQGTLSVKQLARELTTDAAALPTKYQSRVLSVAGKLQKKDGTNLILETGDTDQPFTIYCKFTARNFALLGDKVDYRVRGLCTGLYNPQSLQLDNCETEEPINPKDTRKIIPEYLPHNPGAVDTYDVAQLTSLIGKGEMAVTRQQHQALAANARLNLLARWQTKVIALGTLKANQSLFDAGEPERWFKQKTTKNGTVPGPSYFYRLQAGMIEIGQPVPVKGGVEVVWEPVLKLQAKPGESWVWSYANTQHKYTFTKFDEHNGRPAVVIDEVVIANGDDAHPMEIHHVYVRDVGEVERREYLRVTTKEARLVAEKRRVEDVFPTPKDKETPKGKEPPRDDKPPAKDEKKDDKAKDKEPPAKENKPKDAAAPSGPARPTGPDKP
jgi:hypothetical protein